VTRVVEKPIVFLDDRHWLIGKVLQDNI